MEVQNNLQSYRVWVLIPTLETDDPNLRFYYDFEPALAEYTRAFTELNLPWQWRSVSLGNINAVIEEIIRESADRAPLVLNLCDGDEINGVPGVSVVRELEKYGLVYTGSREYFYIATTSKIPMKEAFDAASVPTAAWEVVDLDNPPAAGIFQRLGSPLIIKPAVSGGSMGLSVRNVVSTQQELEECLAEMRQGYHGWDFRQGGVIAEKFLNGREFTTLVVGYDDDLYFYPPAERVFHESLPEKQRFLSFDRLWETYETEAAMPDENSVYDYAPPEPELFEQLRELSFAAYKSVKGTGYGRLDIRSDKTTGELFVLEVNAQCGLSEDEDYTSIGAILRFAQKNFAELTKRILEGALRAHHRAMPLRKNGKAKNRSVVVS